MNRLAGPFLMATAIGHAMVGIVLFREPLEAILGDGLFNSIQPPFFVAEPYPYFDRVAAFWFVLFSPVLFLLGQIADWATRRRDTHTLNLIAWYCLAIGVVGVIVIPVSGNWILILLGALILRIARKTAP